MNSEMTGMCWRWRITAKRPCVHYCFPYFMLLLIAFHMCRPHFTNSETRKGTKRHKAKQIYETFFVGDFYVRSFVGRVDVYSSRRLYKCMNKLGSISVIDLFIDWSRKTFPQDFKRIFAGKCYAGCINFRAGTCGRVHMDGVMQSSDDHKCSVFYFLSDDSLKFQASYNEIKFLLPSSLLPTSHWIFITQFKSPKKSITTLNRRSSKQFFKLSEPKSN